MTNYDIIVIGGGIGGSSFATGMAAHGARVLVLETETRFRDRVRGEWLTSWGVVEAKKLGIYEPMLRAGAHELRYMRGGDGAPRDLKATTRYGEASLGFYHPAMQEALLSEAANAGAEIWRGSRARVEIIGGVATVVAERHDKQIELHSRLMVAADGRQSATRQIARFDVQQGADHRRVAGILFDDLPAPEDTVQTWRGAYEDPDTSLFVLLFPQGRERVRAYVACPTSAQYRLSGDARIAQIIELFVKSGAQPEYFANVKVRGPLASHQGRHVWIEHPYKDGVALIGEAALVTDPTYGQGMSHVLLDARTLRDCLMQHADWEEAGHAFAEKHDHYSNTLRTYEAWATELWHSMGPEANTRRQRVAAAWQEDPTRNVDIGANGLDLVLDETARKRYFAEDE